MRILFTGATGFIGRQFIRHFDQYNYTILTRSTQRARSTLPDRVTVISELSYLQDCDDFDVVINLAGEPIAERRWTDKQKEIICQSRWQTTQDIVKLIKKSSLPPKVFISGSAIGFYGAAGNDKITETYSAINKDFAHTICDQWEAIARQAKDQTRLIALRTGVVLGNGGALGKMLLPFKLGLGGKMGSGQQYMSWIHIQDMIAAIDFLINTERASGAFNLTAPEPVTNSEFTHTLAKVLHSKARLPIPEGLLRFLMGESADLLLNSQRVIPEKLLDAGFRFTFSTLDTALKDLLKI